MLEHSQKKQTYPLCCFPIIIAGHLPLPADGALITGKVGADLTTDQGYDAARYVGLNILATLKSKYM